jgi:hypothetical protein
VTDVVSREFNDRVAGQAGQPGNLYASRGFLDVIAQVYFPGKTCRIEDYGLGSDVFRLLTVDGEGPVVRQTFLDIHEPLRNRSTSRPRCRLRRLEGASHSIISVDEYKGGQHPPDFFGAPTVLWSGFAKWDDYLDLLRRRRVLADDQRRKRRLEEAIGPLEFRADDQDEDVLTTCFAWKSARDQESSRPDLFSVEANRRFFHEMRARGLLRVSTLRAGGTLLAVWLGAVHQRRWTGWVFAFNNDAALAKYSLGRQLLHFMLEESFRDGHEEFDFSIGMEPYKLYFATHVRVVTTLGSPPLGQRFRAAAKTALAHAPWLYARVRALKQRLELTLQLR